MLSRQWEALTAPSPLLRDAHARRQARLVASLLVLLLPAYVVMAIVSALTRPTGVSLAEALTGLTHFALAFAAYALTRTRHYLRGALLLTVVAVGSSAIVGLLEPVPLRALVSLTLGLTGVVYAGFLLSARATLLTSAAHLVLSLAVVAAHPTVHLPDAVLPLFLALFVQSLTVLGAWLRERQLHELEATNELLVATGNAAPDAVLVVDAVFNVVQWGGRAEEIFGTTPSQAIGKPLSQLVTPADQLVEAIKGGQVTRFEFRATTSEGRIVPCEASVAPLVRHAGAAVFLRDLSERKRMEGKLIFADRLETMGRVVAGVAHEINNPLSFIHSNLRFVQAELRKTAVDADLRSAIDESLDGARRIQDIVQDLRGFSHDGPGHEHLVPVDVERAMDSALRIVEPQLEEVGARVVREYTSVGTVMAVENRLCQVFLNLLANAAQALPKEATKRDIVVSVRVEGSDRVAVSVKDSGVGMDAALRERLFTPFFTTKAQGQGTGLGLYIAQLIISGLKGDIRVESTLGEGSTFSVILWREVPGTPSTPALGAVSVGDA